MFTGVYGLIGGGSRELFWEELGAIRGLWDDPWCLGGGDFNMIGFPSEQNREGRISGDMRRFFEVIDELGLEDIPLQGGCFTWRGGNERRARLDLFLFTKDWDAHFGGVGQCFLQSPVSDHFPILLEG